jgi:hypothetical protein
MSLKWKFIGAIIAGLPMGFIIGWIMSRPGFFDPFINGANFPITMPMWLFLTLLIPNVGLVIFAATKTGGRP